MGGYDAAAAAGVFAGAVWEHGVLIPILPFMEQTTLFNAYNGNLRYTTPANNTILATGFSGYWCPSDALVSQKGVFYGYTVAHNSYRGVSGPWCNPPRGVCRHAGLVELVISAEQRPGHDLPGGQRLDFFGHRWHK